MFLQSFYMKLPFEVFMLIYIRHIDLQSIL